MDPRKVLDIVLREMCAYGVAYRLDWSDFDGRSLMRELGAIDTWAEEALLDPNAEDYREGTKYLESVR